MENGGGNGDRRRNMGSTRSQLIKERIVGRLNASARASRSCARFCVHYACTRCRATMRARHAHRFRTRIKLLLIFLSFYLSLSSLFPLFFSFFCPSTCTPLLFSICRAFLTFVHLCDNFHSNKKVFSRR